jgi:outer membrane receptor protein involved in Fe transport
MRLLSIGVCLFLFSVFASVTQAQSPSNSAASSTKSNGASISGTVFDPDGRVVPGAQVTLLHAMAELEERETNAQGQFNFEDLQVGDYQIIARISGLDQLPTGVTLGANEKRVADLHLKLSAVQNRVVVSAGLGGELTTQTGSSLSVVGKQEIDDRGAQAALDVLRGLPGVEINQSGGRGTVTSAFIRGGDSDYNLIMIDGIPMNDFGGGFDLAPLPAEGVEQVEVIRGPQSAIYGSNAVAGTINIETVRGDGPPHFSFLGEAGSLYTWRVASEGSGLTHGFSWGYGMSRIQTRGQVQNDGYRNQQLTLNLGYSRSTRREFHVHFFGDAGAVGLPGPYGSDPDEFFPGLDPSTHERQNLFGYQASYTERFSSKFQQVSSVSVSTDRFEFISPSEGDSFTNNLRLAASTRSEIAVSSKDTFVAGFEYDRDSYKDTFVDDATGAPFTLGRNSYAGFAENRWTPSERWYITAGVRLDGIQTDALPTDPVVPSNTLVKVSPRVSAAYLLRNPSADGFFGTTRLHSSFGTGFRPPNGFELAFTDNPKLKPEESISVDAGIEQRMASNRLIFDATYFYNHFKDQIVSTGNLPTNFDSENIGRSRAYGVETSIRVRPTQSLEFSGSYTWDNTAILALAGFPGTVIDPYSVDEPLVRRPHNAAGFNATWTKNRLMLNMSGTIRGAVLDIEPNEGTFACSLTNPATMLPYQCLFRNPGYELMNAGFSYRFLKGVEIYGHINNFLNQRYEEAFGFPSLRLNFIAGFKIDLPSPGSR